MDLKTINTEETLGFEFIEMMKPDDIFVETLLAKGLFNDYLFERVFFKLKIKLNNISGLIYRRLWESIYLRTGLQSHLDEGDNITLYVSLSEMITYIKSVTPPILKHLIDDSIKSIDSISTLIEKLLSDKSVNNDITYNVSMFKQLMHLSRFNTDWMDDMCPLNHLFERNKLEYGCYIMHSNKSLSYIVSEQEHSALDPLIAYAMFGCNSNDMSSLLSLLHILTTDWQIVNICDSNGKFYVTAHGVLTNSKSLLLFRKIIKQSYSTFLS